MKNLSITAASAAALCLTLSSLPAQAQKNSACASTPGGCPSQTQIPSAVQTILVVEEIVSSPKAGANTQVTSLGNMKTTYRLVPTGMTYSGPVRLCMKYNSGSSSANAASNKVNSVLREVLHEVKDKSGKATYRPVAGAPEDDKINSQMCVRLASF
jgi:hypothetical protein